MDGVCVNTRFNAAAEKQGEKLKGLIQFMGKMETQPGGSRMGSQLLEAGEKGSKKCLR